MEFKLKYTIYKTVNLKNGKFYIGKHQTYNEYDDYLGSGIALEKAIQKYGKSNFYKEILFIFDNEFEMNQKEKEIITEELLKDNKSYNIGIGGEGGPHFKNKKHSNITKNKISKSSRGKQISLETKNKLSEKNRNKTFSLETRNKLSEKAKIRFSKKEEREKHSNRMILHYKNNMAVE